MSEIFFTAPKVGEIFFKQGRYSPEGSKILPEGEYALTKEEHGDLIRDQSTGKVLSVVDGRVIAQDPPLPLLAEIKATAQQKIIIDTDRTIEQFVSQYPTNERLTWSEQGRMAREFIAGTASEDESNNLRAMASIRGFANASEMVNKIIEKADFFVEMSLKFVSLKGDAYARIENATTSEHIDNIVLEFNHNLKNLITLFKGG